MRPSCLVATIMSFGRHKTMLMAESKMVDPLPKNCRIASHVLSYETKAHNVELHVFAKDKALRSVFQHYCLLLV